MSIGYSDIWVGGENPVSAPVDGEPAKHTKHMCHPFVGYDQAPAQVGDDDGPARVRGSGGDDDDGDDFDMSEAALQKVVAANPVAAPVDGEPNPVAAPVDGEPAKYTKHTKT